MIRSATIADKVPAIRLLRDSQSGLKGVFDFPFDPAYAERLFLSYLDVPRRLCLVNDVDGVTRGVLMAHAYEHPFGPVWFAQERLWWIDPAHRGGTAAVRMLDAYDQWWATQGCAAGGMAGMGEDPAIRVLYERRGYRVAERNFLKVLAA